MEDLVPLQVRIGLKTADGRLMHKYPDFNSLSPSVRGHTDWSVYIDQFGGWHYDKVAGHSDHDPKDVGDDRFDSPQGTWLGLMLVPEEFANAAVKKFPDTCEIVNEEAAATFYDVRVAVNQPAVHEDVEVLQAMAAKKQLGQLDETDSEYVQAMDVSHPSRGRRVNHMKTWDSMKQRRGFKIKSDLSKD